MTTLGCNLLVPCFFRGHVITYVLLYVGGGPFTYVSISDQEKRLDGQVCRPHGRRSEVSITRSTTEAKARRLNQRQREHDVL